MDGTASLTFPLSYYQREGRELQNKVSGEPSSPTETSTGMAGMIKADPSVRHIDFVFTAADKADGADQVHLHAPEVQHQRRILLHRRVLQTVPRCGAQACGQGTLRRKPLLRPPSLRSVGQGDFLLVTRQEFERAVFKSYKVLREFGITDAPYFIPPYEHYNATISSWAPKSAFKRSTTLREPSRTATTPLRE